MGLIDWILFEIVRVPGCLIYGMLTPLKNPHWAILGYLCVLGVIWWSMS